MERLVLVECPELAEEDERGERLRRFARVVQDLVEVCPWVDPVRPGVCTLPVRGPARYFGDERAVLGRVEETVLATTPAVRLGVAEGTFAAALAARMGTAVPAGGTRAFLARWPVGVLGDPELAEVLVRLGLPTLGGFTTLPAADVLARFGAAGARLHRVAAGLDGELPGYRVPGLGARLVTALGQDLAPREHQPGFWGGAGAADERAAEVLTALQRRLGVEAVVVAVVTGGRGPSDRVRLVPWRPTRPATPGTPTRPVTPGTPGTPGTPTRPAQPAAPGEAPWPGRLPPPAPARVGPRGEEAPVEVVDRGGAPVGVGGRGLLTAVPDRISIAGRAWAAVVGWSAPWPAEEGWWSEARRRSARLQVVTAEGRAHLLVLERGRWRLEATYD